LAQFQRRPEVPYKVVAYDPVTKVATIVGPQLQLRYLDDVEMASGLGPSPDAPAGSVEREFVEGAFYWARKHGIWTVAKFGGFNPGIDGDEWHSVDWALSSFTDELSEIGPCLGKEPPGWGPSYQRELHEDIQGMGGH
jgi:hypothetical protein